MSKGQTSMDINTPEYLYQLISKIESMPTSEMTPNAPHHRDAPARLPLMRQAVDIAKALGWENYVERKPYRSLFTHIHWTFKITTPVQEYTWTLTECQCKS